MKKFLALIGIIALLSGCEKAENVRIYPNDQVKIVSTHPDKDFDSYYLNMVEQRAVRLLSEVDVPHPIPPKATNASVTLFAPGNAMGGNYSYAAMHVDSGMVSLASFSCKLKAGSGLKYLGITTTLFPVHINWGNYYTAYAVSADSTSIAFAAFTLTPDTIQYNPNSLGDRKWLFWVVTSGSGATEWDLTYPDNIAISADGYSNEDYLCINGQIQ